MVNNLTDQERDERIEQLRQALTVRQLKFADGVLDGLSQSEAYRRAYPSAKKKIETSAARLAKSAKVCGYLRAVRSKESMEQAHRRASEAQDRVFSRHEKREILASIGRDQKHPANSRIQAVNVDNAMTGDNEPVRVEFTLSGIVNALRGTTDLPAAEAKQVEEADPVAALTNGNGQNGHNGNGGHS